MKYEVNHTLSGVVHEGGDVQKARDVRFKPGEVVTEAQLKEGGFDHEFLLKNGSIEELKGTESDGERAARRQNAANGINRPAPTTTQDATPGMGNAPAGPGKPDASAEKVGFGDTSNRQLGKTAAGAGDEDEPTFRGRKLSDFDGIADDRLTSEEGIGDATAADIVKARHKRDRSRK